MKASQSMQDSPQDGEPDEILLNGIKLVIPTQKRKQMWSTDSGTRRLHNGAELKLTHCFGVNPKPVEKSFGFVEDDVGFGIRAGNNLLYTTQQQVLCHSLETRKQEEIVYERRGDVTYLTNYKYRDEIVILMAETTLKESPRVLLVKYSTKKQTILPHNHLPTSSIIRHAVVTKSEVKNKKLCYTVCWRPCLISIWRMDKQALVAVHEGQCAQPRIAIDPMDPCRFVVSGSRYLRAWNVSVLEKLVEEDKTHLIPLKNERDEFFLDIAFLPGTKKLVALCAGSRVLFVENGNVVYTMENVMSGSKEDDEEAGQSPLSGRYHSETPSEPSDACKLLLTKKNLVLGGSEGTVALYFFEPTGGMPTFLSFFRLEAKAAQVISLSLSVDEQWLAVGCQMPIESVDSSSTPKTSRTIDLDDWTDRRIEGFLVNIRKLESENTNFVTKLFPNSLHYGEVIDATEAVSRHAVVSVGEDMTLKVWRYGKGWVGGASIKLMDPPTVITVHPVGFQVAVGSRESLKIFLLLEDDVALSLDQSVKTCRAATYSPNGEYLAFSSGNTIIVMSPYTNVQLASLFGHSAIIQSLVWTHKSGQLISSCLSGTVCVWAMNEPEAKTFTNRQYKLKAASYDDSIDDLLILTQDGHAKIINSEEERIDFSSADGNTRFTSMLLRKDLGLLFLGTSKGTIQVRLWPVLSLEDVTEFQLHRSDVTSITLSVTYQEVITTSQDHTLCISNVTTCDSGAASTITAFLASVDQPHKPHQMIASVEYLSLNGLSLVRDTYVQQQADRIQELEDTISTLQSKFKYKTETAEKQYQDLLSHLKTDHSRILEIEHSEVVELRRRLELERAEKTQSISALKSEYEKQLADEIRKGEIRDEEQREKYETLNDELEELKQEYASQLYGLGSAHEQVKIAIQYDASAQIDKISADYDDLLQSLKRQGEIYEMGLTQNENEYEFELANEREKMNKKIDEINEQLREIKTVNKRLMNEKDLLTHRDEERKREFSTLEEERNTLKKECEELRTNLTRAQEQMQEREEVIKKKETTIKELRSFNIHLQNFRYVLDEKIKELKDDRGPLGMQLTNLQEQIRNMYAELLDEYEKTEHHSKLTKELRGQTKELTKANAKLKNEVFVAKRKLSLIQSDLVQLLRYTNKDTILPELQRLTEKHLQLDELYSTQEMEADEGGENGVEGSDMNKVKSELLYQHDLVRDQLTAAQKKSKAHEQKTEQELRLKMKENATLIDECNKLRVQLNEMKRANANLRDQNNQLQGRLREPMSSDQRFTRGIMTGAGFGRKGSSEALMPPSDIKGQLYKSADKEDRRMRTSANPLRVNKLVTELEKNQREILEQNVQFQRLQEQVSLFLYKPSTAAFQRIQGKTGESSDPPESRRVFVSPSNPINSRLSTMRSNPTLPKLMPEVGEKLAEGR